MGNVYLKLLSQDPLRCQCALDMAQSELTSALSHVTDRLLWGSGWPHLLMPPDTTKYSSARAARPRWSTTMLDLNARAVDGFDD